MWEDMRARIELEDLIKQGIRRKEEKHGYVSKLIEFKGILISRNIYISSLNKQSSLVFELLDYFQLR